MPDTQRNMTLGPGLIRSRQSFFMQRSALLTRRRGSGEVHPLGTSKKPPIGPGGPLKLLGRAGELWSLDQPEDAPFRRRRHQHLVEGGLVGQSTSPGPEAMPLLCQ